MLRIYQSYSVMRYFLPRTFFLSPRTVKTTFSFVFKTKQHTCCVAPLLCNFFSVCLHRWLCWVVKTRHAKMGEMNIGEKYCFSSKFYLCFCFDSDVIYAFFGCTLTLKIWSFCLTLDFFCTILIQIWLNAFKNSGEITKRANFKL